MKPDVAKTKLAWQKFADGGDLAANAVREHVARAWKRCRQNGVNPRSTQAARLSPERTAELVSEKRDLVEAAAPFLRALSIAAGDERHAAVLSDETGLVLEIVADDETARQTVGFPSRGTLLAESVAGTNGIGTPLAEGDYVEIVGPEHFIEGFHGYTCQGLPLKSLEGEIVGALSMAVRHIEAAERVHEILICAAHGIEAELIHRWLGHERAEALRQLGSTTPAIEALRQDVTQLQTAARLRLEQAAIITRNGAEGALDFVSIADQLIRRFRNQSVLWRDIAVAEVGAPKAVDLQFRLVEVAELMATEAAIHGVRARISNGPPVHVTADPSELSRSLFRCFLKSFETLKGGGDVVARVEHYPRRGVARVAFSVPQHMKLEFPLAKPEDRF